MKRILYIHHGGGLGGAPLSLLYLLKQIDRARYEPIVLTLKPGPVVDLYRAEGIETHVAQGVADFSHTELEWYGGHDLWRLPIQVARFWPSIVNTRRYLRQFKPDLVHLNSSTLAGMLAFLLFFNRLKSAINAINELIVIIIRYAIGIKSKM